MRNEPEDKEAVAMILVEMSLIRIIYISLSYQSKLPDSPTFAREIHSHMYLLETRLSLTKFDCAYSSIPLACMYSTCTVDKY